MVLPWEYKNDPRSTVMHFAVVRWCTYPSPAMLPLSDLPLILRNEFLPWSCENSYKYAVWDLTHVVPTNVAIVDLDKHFAIGRCMHRGRRITWKMLQAVIATDWHWLPGYCITQGFCGAHNLANSLQGPAKQD